MTRIGIIGGGPGGLMTAHLLARTSAATFRTTVLEATDRLGGKLQTRTFTEAPVPYEAGAAEIYDYSGLGDDPLKRLVTGLGLAIRPMNGQTVVMDGTALRDEGDIVRSKGPTTLREIRAFRERAAALLPLDAWHPGSWQADNIHPWAKRSCRELLDTVSDPAARKYLSVAVHSDLATEPHLTTGLNGLKNFVMDVPGYLGFYAVEGGMGRLADALRRRLGRTEVLLGTRVTTLSRTFDGTWRVGYESDGVGGAREFDGVVLALPASHLGSIEYVGEPLRSAMDRHVARFDRPGHYLRVSLLFRRPFWEGELTGSWFMVDAFGGACVYDESARYDTGGYGVLGFLIAGNDALAAMGISEDVLVRRVVASLPHALRGQAAALLLEARVHRWCGGVSGQPGGSPLGDPATGHMPDELALPGLHLVGDYLFDSTLNGVLRSAELTTSLLSACARPSRPAVGPSGATWPA